MNKKRKKQNKMIQALKNLGGLAKTYLGNVVGWPLYVSSRVLMTALDIVGWIPHKMWGLSQKISTSVLLFESKRIMSLMTKMTKDFEKQSKKLK